VEGVEAQSPLLAHDLQAAVPDDELVRADADDVALAQSLLAYELAVDVRPGAAPQVLDDELALLAPHLGVLSTVHAAAANWDVTAEPLARRLEAQVLAELPGATVAWVAECRYARQGYELDVPVRRAAWQRVAGDFHDVHERSYGYRDPASAVEVIALRAIGTVPAAAPTLVASRQSTIGANSRLRICLEGGYVDAAGYDWESLRDGQVIAGPAVIEGLSATALVPAGWVGRVNAIGAIVVERGDARPR